MSSVLERVETLSGSTLDPIPRDERRLGGLDVAVLWGDLGIGMLVLVAGALLVPGLGFGAATAAILAGSMIGVALLAMGAVAGARYGVPTMVMFRPILGVRGSWVPSALNAVQLLGWTAFELWAMSLVADLVSQQVFGFSARWLWLTSLSIVCAALALWGPVGVTRLWMEKFGAWLIVAIAVAVTILVLTADGLADAVRAPGTGGFPTFGAALDLVIAMPVSWLPLVADYTRHAKTERQAGAGTFFGYLIANVWLYTLGALLVVGAQAEPSPAGIAAGVLALAGGSVAGLLFLAGLLVGETDEAFANIYSGALSLKNIFPKLPQPVLIICVAATGTVLAAWLDMDRYEVFLFLLGSVFVPLFGVLAADLTLPRGSVRRNQFSTQGAEGPPLEPARFIPWVAGFFVFHWVAPTEIGWWKEAIVSMFGSPLSESFTWLPASVPSFAAAYALTIVVQRVSRR